MANNQDKKLKALEAYLEEQKTALDQSTDRGQRIDIKSEISKIEAIIKEEKKFRRDRDDVLKRKNQFDARSVRLEKLIENLNDPLVKQGQNVSDRQEAWDYLQDEYKTAFGGEEFPRGEDGGADFVAALAQIKHQRDKLQIELDSVYGNVDKDMLDPDLKELSDIEKGLEENKERTKNYRELKQKMANLKNDPDYNTKCTEYKNKMASFKMAEQELENKKKAVKDIEEEINKIQKEIDDLNNELKRLKSPKDDKRIAEINKELNSRRVRIYQLNKDLTQAQKELADAEQEYNTYKGELEALNKDPGMEDFFGAMKLLEALGIKDNNGDPYELSIDINDDIKTVNKAHKSEKLSNQKREMQERATHILDKWGVVADKKKGKYVEALENRVDDILQNYNPVHIQPGFYNSPEKAQENPASPGTVNAPAPGEVNTPAPGGGNAPAPGGGSTPAPRGGNAPDLNAPTTGGNVPAQGGTNTPNPPVESGNIYNTLLSRGVIVEKIDGDVDYKTLASESDRTKIDGGFVYRVADVGPSKEDPNKREYAQVKEPLDWYLEDTEKKLGRAVTELVSQLRVADRNDLDQLWDDMGKGLLETNLLRNAVKSTNPVKRFLNKRDLMKEIEGIEPKAQVELLIALTTFSDQDPMRAAKCIGNMHGNPYPRYSNLVTVTQTKGRFRKKQETKVVTSDKSEAKSILDGYDRKSQGETRRPQSRQRTREHGKEKPTDIDI